MSTNYCRHIRASGTRCRSLALAGGTLCFWHRDLHHRHRVIDPVATLPAHIPDHHRNLALLKRDPILSEYYGVNLNAPAEFDFPPLEDRESIQIALSMVLNALGRNRLEPKRAGVMLYTLQVASANAASLEQNPANVIRHTVCDESGHHIAPDEDPQEVSDARALPAPPLTSETDVAA